MNEKNYCCPNCHVRFSLEELENNIDGCCEHCDYPLQEIGKESFKYTHAIQKNKENPFLQRLKDFTQDKLWEQIEKINNPLERIKERNLFFQALKSLKIKFELWEK